MNHRRERARRQWMIVFLLLPTLAAAATRAEEEPTGGGAAGEEPEVERARALFGRGLELIAEEDYPSALSAFGESYALAPRPTTLYNIGMCQMGMFLNLEAIATLDRYLAETAGDGETELREHARTAIAEMQAQLGRLAIEGTPDGAEVLVGGRRAGTTPLAGPVAVNPGLHTVRIEKDGFSSFETRVTVASAREVAVEFSLEELPERDEYAALLARAEQARREKEARAARLEQEWAKVERIALEAELGREERILVLGHFLDEFPVDNPHRERARLWQRALEDGKEPADVLEPGYLRTKTEWAALRLGGGNYGGSAMLSVVTLRWPLIAWDILRLSGGGGVLDKVSGSGDEGDAEREERRWIASGGTAVAIPWHFEDTGRFEIRFGLGLMVGKISSAEQDVLGLIFVPEGVLVWHAFEYLAFQAGIDLQFGAIDFKGGFSFPTPALGAFIGIRI